MIWRFTGGVSQAMGSTFAVPYILGKRALLACRLSDSQARKDVVGSVVGF